MTRNAISNLVLLKDIKEFIIPLSDEEFLQLEKNIVTEGCRDPLIVWQKKDELILVDGHNRYKICQKHTIPYKIKSLDFKDMDEVKLWMVDNQMGRRNLTPDQMSYYRGIKYLALKKKKGGYEKFLLKGQSMETSGIVANQFSVSESTVKRDAKFAEGLNIIQQSNPKLKTKILSGVAKVKKADVQVLASAKHPQKITIKNEADLYNKAKIIRDEILQDVEAGVNRVHREKEKKAHETLKGLEPVFIDRDDRLRKIKGMIISAINRAIRERDSKAIKELKKLIERLEGELFD